MMRSLKLHANLLLFLILNSGCASYRISDFQASITLPASQDCYSYNVVSGKETRISANDKKCIDKKARAIWLDSENYKLLKQDIQRNCQLSKCKQLTGAFDELFLKIDSALLLINK